MADGKVSVDELIKLVEENSDNKKLKDAMKKLGVLKGAKLDLGIETGDLEKMRQSAELLRLQADYLGQIGDREALRTQLAENLNKLQTEYDALAKTDETLEARNELNKLMEQTREQAKELGFAIDAAGKKIVELSPAAKQAAKEAKPAFESLARKMGMASNKQETMTASMIRGFTMLQSKDGLKGVFESFTSVFGVINIAESIVLKFVESTIMMVKEFDKASASFAAATGAADKYTGALLGAQKQGNIAGVTFDNAGNAIKGLFEGFVGFVDISESGQAALVQDAALFERIGVNAQTSAKMLTTFTRNLDMSTSGAMHMTKALSQMGDEIGVSAQKMMSDFEAAFKSLAVYGDQSIEVFQGLSAAAKAAGVEVATLTSIAGKFDTFSGAAESVGKLNALLGSQISSTEMLMMTEDQRIETLIQQVQLSGTNFKDMNKFQQMAIANAAGIQDMAEAQRIFGMSFNEYGTYKDRMQAQTNVQENFSKAIEATLPFQEKFAIFMREMAVFVGPLTEMFGGILDAFLAFAKLGDGVVLATVGIVSAFAMAVAIGKAMIGTYTTVGAVKKAALLLTNEENIKQAVNNVQKGAEQSLLTSGIPFRMAENQQRLVSNKLKQEEIGTNQVLAPTQVEVGATSRFAAGGLLQMALAVAAVAAGIGVAAAGLGYFAQSFKDLNSEQLETVGYALVGLALGFTVLIIALAKMTATGAATLASAALVQLGVGVLAIGAGIGLAAAGMGMMAEGIGKIASEGTNAIAILTGLSAVMISMGGIGIISTIGAVTSLAALYAALKEIGDLMEDSKPLQNGLENMALVVTGRSAKATTQGATEAVAQLKTAFSGLMEQKVTISLDIKDGAFANMIEDVVINGMSATKNGKIYQATVKAVNSVGG